MKLPNLFGKEFKLKDIDVDDGTGLFQSIPNWLIGLAFGLSENSLKFEQISKEYFHGDDDFY